MFLSFSSCVRDGGCNGGCAGRIAASDVGKGGGGEEGAPF